MGPPRSSELALLTLSWGPYVQTPSWGAQSPLFSVTVIGPEVIPGRSNWTCSFISQRRRGAGMIGA